MAHSAIKNLKLDVLRAGGPSFNAIGRQGGSSGLGCEGFCGEGLWFLGCFCWLLSCIRHVFLLRIEVQTADKAFDAPVQKLGKYKDTERSATPGVYRLSIKVSNGRKIPAK